MATAFPSCQQLPQAVNSYLSSWNLNHHCDHHHHHHSHDDDTWERSRDFRETRGLSHVGTIVDKEFFPRFRYIKRLRMMILMYDVRMIMMVMMLNMKTITIMTILMITWDVGRPLDESRSLYCATNPIFSARPDLKLLSIIFVIIIIIIIIETLLLKIIIIIVLTCWHWLDYGVITTLEFVCECPSYDQMQIQLMVRMMMMMSSLISSDLMLKTYCW